MEISQLNVKRQWLRELCKYAQNSAFLTENAKNQKNMEKSENEEKRVENLAVLFGRSG